jgi:UDP-glucose 4-epimerase
LDQGLEVVALDDLSTGCADNLGPLLSNPRFRFVHGSVLEEDLVAMLMKDADMVYHLAAAVGVKLIVDKPIHTIETNILGTQVVLKNAHRFGVKTMIFSTSEVYGKREEMPLREDDDRVVGPTTKCRWSYSASKAIDEFLALAYHAEFDAPLIVVRLFNIIGPNQTGQYGMVVPRFVGQALAGRPVTVYGDGSQSRCFCDVRDAVRGMQLLSRTEAALGEVFNLGSDREITIGALAELVLERTGSVSPIQHVAFEDAYGAGFEDIRRRVPALDKIRDVCGYVPEIDLESSVDRIIDAMRSRDSSA